jgi:hypothetical protein
VVALGAGGLLLWCNRPAPDILPIARPYLWEVRGEGSAAPSYLFGTIHIGYGLRDLPAVVLAAQARSKITVTESDLDRNLKTGVAMLEPLMLFLIAGFIGTIFIGMVLPIFTMQQHMK